MGKPAILAIKVLSDTRKAKKGLQETEHATGRLMGALGKLGGIALAGAAAAGGALAALAITGIKQAADLEQSIGAVDTVFKGAADQMHRYAAGAGPNRKPIQRIGNGARNAAEKRRHCYRPIGR